MGNESCVNFSCFGCRTAMKNRIPFLLLLAMIGMQITFMYYGPVTTEQRNDAVVYRPHTLVLLLLNAAFFLAGCWLCLKHLRAYGWRNTLFSATEKWGPQQKESTTGLALFAFGLIFLGLNVWQALQADFVVVAPEGFREGSGADLEHPVVTIDFRNLRSIDFNHRESSGQRRGWCLRFIDRAGNDQLVRRNSLVNAAAARIAQQARSQGVDVLND
jgi:hypothetical protein